MSAYICGDQTINRIIDLIWNKWNSRFQHLFKKYEFPQYLSMGGNEGKERFGICLFNMNGRAVEGLEKELHPKMTQTEFWKKHGLDTGKTYQYEETDSISELQGIKTLHCFLYQCDHESVAHWKAWKMLNEWLAEYSQFIIQKIPEYDKAEWG